MQRIALAYMEKIGFADQPFLVYRHRDAAHDHVHIATVSIRSDGTPINLHNIGRLLSEPARKSIEEDFGLIKAESTKLKPAPAIRPADITAAAYGHLPTKRAISNVVSAVTATYAFTSLPELNAVLKQFNVMADRGGEDTEMFRKRGLVYSLLDNEGNKTGVPIKASSFYKKPTFFNLEKQFEKNSEKKQPYKEPLKDTIDNIFAKYGQLTKETFISELADENICAAFRTAKARKETVPETDKGYRIPENAEPGNILPEALTIDGISEEPTENKP